MVAQGLRKETPLIYSSVLSEKSGAEVYLKLENLHPSYSFKYRGISLFVKKAQEELGSDVHLVIASGGNAGLAAACAARSLNLRCTVFIPDGVAQTTLDVLRRERAEVVVGGRQYSDALNSAAEMVAQDPKAVMVPAYDHPTLWEGHSSMIHEIRGQLEKEPDAIFCSVGGGGLLGGIIVGCKGVGWDHVPLVALETIGSNCFYESMALNGGRFNSTERKLDPSRTLVYNEAHSVCLSRFSSFSSKASGSLGASEPAAGVVRMALDRKGGVKTTSVPDELSMEALAAFADDHKLLVELACSTTLVPAYYPELFDKLVPPKQNGDPRVVVFVVCGGFKTDLTTAVEYRELASKYRASSDEPWAVKYDDGQDFKFAK